MDPWSPGNTCHSLTAVAQVRFQPRVFFTCLPLSLPFLSLSVTIKINKEDYAISDWIHVGVLNRFTNTPTQYYVTI